MKTIGIGVAATGAAAAAAWYFRDKVKVYWEKAKKLVGLGSKKLKDSDISDAPVSVPNANGTQPADATAATPAPAGTTSHQDPAAAAKDSEPKSVPKKTKQPKEVSTSGLIRIAVIGAIIVILAGLAYFFLVMEDEEDESRESNGHEPYEPDIENGLLRL